MLRKIFLILVAGLGFFAAIFAEEKLAETKKAEQVVILGSGPAGLTSAIYASRAGLSTTLIDGNEPGGQITLSYLVDNFPGFPEGISGFELSERMKQQAQRFGAKLESGQVVRVDLSSRPFTLFLDDGKKLQAQSLIVATGASAKWLDLPSEKKLIGRGVTSCAVCDGAMYKDKEVVVIGGGDAAVEDAVFLTNYASKVTLVHRRDKLRASKHLQKKAFANEKIHFVWDSEVQEIFDPAKGEVEGIKIKNKKSGAESIISCQGVFVAIGHEPNTGLFVHQLDMNKEGYLTTEPFSTRTNIPGVFAAGDVADPKFRQAVTAAGSGSMAALEAYNFMQSFSD
ncbi:MAG: thioredoxin-disulfide reductase [Simkaniaceae bacterium]